MTVMVITAIAVVAMIIFKDFVNRSEAMRAMGISVEESNSAGMSTAQFPPNPGSIGKGYIVLRLGAVLRDDGCPEWISRKEFKTLLAQQQSPEEIQMLQQ